MKLEDVEAIVKKGHKMEITVSSRPGKWNVTTKLQGEIMESYRPLSKVEVLELVRAALVES